MKQFKIELSLERILKIINVPINVTDKLLFNNVAELNEANCNSVCFFENEKYLKNAENSNAGLIFIPENTTVNNKSSLLIPAPKPYLAFMTLVSHWLAMENAEKIHTISPQASVSESAIIGKNVHIGPFAVIEDNVKIGDNSIIEANTVIKENTCLGNNCRLLPNVTVYQDCILHNNVIIHSGSVIGADGFGYALINGQQIKIPQVGNVEIEDNVEIGANSCIDRATIGKTLVKSGAKIDNLVQIGHNCSLGESSITCAQVGLAGNTSTGKLVYLGGQAGLAGHLHIDDNTLIGAQTGVMSSLKEDKYFGTPAMPIRQQLRVSACLKDLPEITKYVKKLMRDKNERI